MRRRMPIVARRMRGLTLLELLISMTLGLVIIAATFAGYLGLSEAARMAEAQSRMNEDGQAALAVLAANLRMAGNNPEQPFRIPATRVNPVYTSPTSFAVRGCDGRFTNITSPDPVPDLICGSGAASAPDSIAITYEADRFNTIAAALMPTDCLGNPLPAQQVMLTVVSQTPPHLTEDRVVQYHVAENRFYIDSSAGVPSLFCRGNGAGGTPRPLVENVEDLQLTYGVIPVGAPADSTLIAGYLDATDLGTHSNLAGLPNDAARWKQVAAVRVCVVVRSQKPITGSAGSARYLRCDGTIESNPPDFHLRRAYTTTVVLRNRL